MNNEGIVSKIVGPEGQTEMHYTNGAREYVMANGMKKRVYADGLIILQLKNNDIKVCHPDGR